MDKEKKVVLFRVLRFAELYIVLISLGRGSITKNRPLGSEFFIVAPPVRLELTTSKLTASCSTIELQGNL